MKFIPLRYINNYRPEVQALMPVSGRTIKAKVGESVPVPEQDVAELLASGLWEKASATKSKKAATPKLEKRPESDLETRDEV